MFKLCFFARGSQAYYITRYGTITTNKHEQAEYKTWSSAFHDLISKQGSLTTQALGEIKTVIVTKESNY